MLMSVLLGDFMPRGHRPMMSKGIAAGRVQKCRPGVEGCNPAVLMRGLCLCGLTAA